MNTQKLGYSILVIGILASAFSLVVDYLGLGKPGIQAAQLLGIQAGVMIALLGVGVVIAGKSVKRIPSSLSWGSIDQLLNLPTYIWVISAFLIVYVLLFVFPVFLNPVHRIQYFNRYIPEIAPIGNDLRYNTGNIRDWLSSQAGLYDSPEHYYPPLYAVVFAPILLVSYPANYYLITAVTIGSTILLFLLIPAFTNARSVSALSAFFLPTVIFSYGMQFELERGQFNIIAFTLCMLAIYLYHYHEAFRHFAYLLFSVAVQIKIYPAIFIFMFIKDWRDWKNNLLRFVGLGLFNIALLFVLGYSVFLEFFRALIRHMGLSLTFPGNHSIKAFVYNLTNSGFGLFQQSAISWLKNNSSAIEALFFAFYFLCLLAQLLKAYKNKASGINPDLLLTCTIGAMILPAVSIDYKLPLLAAPMAMVLSQRSMSFMRFRKILAILLVFFLSFAYSMTLFPYIYRPEYLANSLPMLIVILAAITLLSFLDSGTGTESARSEKQPAESSSQ